MVKTYRILLVDISNNNFSREIEYSLDVSHSVVKYAGISKDFDAVDHALDYLWGEGNLSDDCNRASLLYDEYDEDKYDCTEYILARAIDSSGKVIFDEIGEL